MIASWPNLHALVDPLLRVPVPYSQYDCWGLVTHLVREGLGITLAGDPNDLNTQLREVWSWDDDAPLLGLLQPWDIVLVSIHSLVGEHVGLMVDDIQMISTRVKTGAVLEPLAPWHRRKQLVQVLRLREMV